METPTQLAAAILSSNTAAYVSGFKVGLSSHSSIRYSSSNPYDRRKQTGKDWELGKKVGTELLCSCGAEYAAAVLSAL